MTLAELHRAGHYPRLTGAGRLWLPASCPPSVLEAVRTHRRTLLDELRAELAQLPRVPDGEAPGWRDTLTSMPGVIRARAALLESLYASSGASQETAGTSAFKVATAEALALELGVEGPSPARQPSAPLASALEQAHAASMSSGPRSTPRPWSIRKHKVYATPTLR